MCLPSAPCCTGDHKTEPYQVQSTLFIHTVAWNASIQEKFETAALTLRLHLGFFQTAMTVCVLLECISLNQQNLLSL